MKDRSSADTQAAALDMRLYQLPDRMEVINNLDVNTKSPLSAMQLWEVDDGPVVIEAPGGESRISMDGRWKPMDSWEAVFEGRPMSYLMFTEKWPGLVSVDEYLASFSSDKDGRAM